MRSLTLAVVGGITVWGRLFAHCYPARHPGAGSLIAWNMGVGLAGGPAIVLAGLGGRVPRIGARA